MAKARNRTKANGEGSIRKRPDGRWEGRVTIGFDSGEQVVKSVYGKTKAQVIEKMNELRTSRGAVIATKKSLTVQDVCDSYLKVRLIQDSLTPATKRCDHASHKRVCRLLGGVPLSKLNPSHIEGMYATMAGNGKGHSVISQAAGFLERALDRAVRHKLMVANPSYSSEKPRFQKSKRGRPLTEEEQAALFKVLKESSLFAFAYLGVSLGFRKGELLGLRWEDIEFDEANQIATITPRRQIVSNSTYAAPQEKLKTPKSHSTMYLSAEGVAVLKAHREYRAGTDGGWVFPHHANPSFMRPGYLYDRWLEALEKAGLWSEALKKAGVKPLRMHDLRHTAISRAAYIAQTPKEHADFARHAQVQHTLEVYTHAKEGSVRRLMLEGSKVFGGA